MWGGKWLSSVRKSVFIGFLSGSLKANGFTVVVRGVQDVPNGNATVEGEMEHVTCESDPHRRAGARWMGWVMPLLTKSPWRARTVRANFSDVPSFLSSSMLVCHRTHPHI